MRTNDTAYHGHFETDENAERLQLFREEKISTDIPFNITNEQDDDSFSTSSMSPMLNVLVNENGDQYDQINEQTIFNDDGDVVSRYNEIAWKQQNYQETNLQPKTSVNQVVGGDGDRAMSSESDQENDRHYSQILPWIHFNL